jgi:exodeoxyribonuclease V alpha subunit
MEPEDARLARRATGLLRTFNQAGVLRAADVHVAARLGALAGEQDDAVLLAAALTVRSTRHGSVVLDLDTAPATTSREDAEVSGPDVVDLPWPPGWVERCAASPLVADGGPLRISGSRLWLGRYADQEEQLARDLLARVADRPGDLDPTVLAGGLDRLFPSPADADQRAAATICATHRVSVLAGGPGTGKTTTVSRLLALLLEQHPGDRVALAAPTGKAAARLAEAVRSSTRDLAAGDRERLGDLPALTLHRLLGWKPGARNRFRHDAGNRLPYEIVVVDESSMVSLTLMARLLEALRPATRLILVGDPDQLASVEAGAVLGDLVAAGDPRLQAGVATLAVNRRFAAAESITELARAIRTGDGAAALAVLRSGSEQVSWVELPDDAPPTEPHLAALRAEICDVGDELVAAALAGDAVGALAALDRHRLLCAHRTGPRGVQRWGDLAAGWVGERHPVVPRADGRHLGEPLLVTANDHEVRLYNGDTGVVVRQGAGMVAVFGRGGEPVRVPLGRLGAVRPVHAMTVHRSQGSQFDHVTLVLPPADSPLGTRETLYTAVTRARSRVRVIGSAEAFLAAVGRSAARATGLRERLIPG